MSLVEGFRIAQTIVLSLALILEALFFAFSFRRKIGTRLCTLLLRSQTLIDSALMLVNLTTIQYFSLLPLPSQTLADWLWLFYCKLLLSGAIHWSLVSMSVYNLVCVAIERCCCLCAPFWYRRNKSKLMWAFAICVFASPAIVEFPFCWITVEFEKKLIENGTRIEKFCRVSHSDHDPAVMNAFGIAYVVLFWALPSVLSVALYVLIMRVIRQSTAVRTSSGADTGAKKVSDGTRRLTLMTGVTSAAFVVLFAMDSVNLFLLCIGYPIEKFGFIDSLDSFLLNLNSAINPLVYLAFMPEFRSFIACSLARQGSAGTGSSSSQSKPN